MRLLLALLFSGPLLAQQGVTMQFSRQGQWLEFDRYRVGICNHTEEAKNFSSVLVRNAAASRGISPVSYSLSQRSLAKKTRMSTTRIMLSVAEAGGWGIGALVAGNAIWKPAANWQRTLPVVGAGAIRLATTLTARHTPAEERLPDDLLPVFISLPAGSGACLEYTLLAVGGAG